MEQINLNTPPTVEQSVQILKNACQQLKLTYPEHQYIANCIKTLATRIDELENKLNNPPG